MISRSAQPNMQYHYQLILCSKSKRSKRWCGICQGSQLIILKEKQIICGGASLDGKPKDEQAQGRTDFGINTARCTRHNSDDSVPTSNLVCIKEVAIRTTFCIAGIIYYTCNLVIDIQCTRYKNAFNKRFSKIVCQNNSAKIYSEKNLTM